MLRISRDSAACAGADWADVRGMSTSYPCMRRGTTTMKMISSTSTTSTSGVMLISDCRPESESSLLICMMLIPPPLCARGLGDQPNSAEACLLKRLHGLPDLAELELCVAPDHDLGICLRTNGGAEGFAEMLTCYLLIVD